MSNPRLFTASLLPCPNLHANLASPRAASSTCLIVIRRPSLLTTRCSLSPTTPTPAHPTPLPFCRTTLRLSYRPARPSATPPFWAHCLRATSTLSLWATPGWASRWLSTRSSPPPWTLSSSPSSCPSQHRPPQTRRRTFSTISLRRGGRCTSPLQPIPLPSYPSPAFASLSPSLRGPPLR